MKGFVAHLEEEMLEKDIKIDRLQKDVKEFSQLKVENEALKEKAASLEKELGQVQVAMIELLETTLTGNKGGDGSA